MSEDRSMGTRPDPHTRRPWSGMELLDLQISIDGRQSVEWIADYMCRSRSEVRRKLREIGYCELAE